MLVRAGDDRDIPAIAEMSAARATGARLALDRSDDWIRFGLAKRRLLAGLGPPGLRATSNSSSTEEGHQAVAYVISTVTRAAGSSRTPAIAIRPARASARCCRRCSRGRRISTPPRSAPGCRTGFVPPQISRVETTPIAEVLMIRPLKDRTLPLPPLDAREVVFWRADFF